MTLSHRFLLCAATSILLAAVPAAQQAAQQGAQQPQPPADQQQPKFQSGTQVVQVDVRVFGKDGHFLTDLKPEDFEVKEDGVPQPIGALTFISGEAVTSSQNVNPNPNPNPNTNPGTPNRTPEPPNPRVRARGSSSSTRRT